MTETITLEIPGPPELVKELAPVVSEAKDFVVSDKDSCALALSRAKVLRTAERNAHDYFEPARKAADENKKIVLQTRNGITEPIAEARKIYEQSATAWEREEMRRAEDERRKREEEERKRAEEAALEEAIAAEEAGDTEIAEAILDEPVTTTPVFVEPTQPKVEGVSKRQVWSAEVTDKAALVKYVAENTDKWLQLVEPAMKELNGLARSQRSALRIPGVRAVCKDARSYRI